MSDWQRSSEDFGAGSSVPQQEFRSWERLAVVAYKSPAKTPERRLQREVFVDGLRQLAHGCEYQRAEARRWVRREGDEWIYSFPQLCDAFGIDADAAREALLGSGCGAAPGRRRAA